MQETSDYVYPTDPTPYVRTDFYLGNRKIRRSQSQPTQFSQALLDEYNRCRDDITYFASRYVKLIHPDRGLVYFDSYPYQTNMWEMFNADRFSIVLASRQSGKTAACVAYLLHTAIFRPNQMIAVVAHKLSQARTIMRRVCLAMENLPFFLQPGCKSYTKSFIEFDNRTIMFASASDNDSLRGESITILYLDEFAFVKNDAEFMRATYPVVTAGTKTKIIITSTANGISNEFHTIYTHAVPYGEIGTASDPNSYKSMRVDWSDVPGRDEEWKRKTIADIGEKRFRVEFGNSFEGTSLTLIDANTLLKLRPHSSVWTGDEGATIYEKPQKDHSYVVTVDTCQGRGKDYSTFTVTDVSVNPFKQVAAYRNSLISPMQFPVLIMKYCKAYNEAVAVIESNDDGASVARDLFYDLEYENVFVESFTKAKGIGVFVDKKVKATGCSKMKDIIENGNYLVTDADTITELKSFERKGKSYEAKEGKHDDMVSTLWLFAWFTDTEVFKQQAGGFDLKKAMRDEAQRAEEASFEFAGIFGNAPDLMDEMIARGYYSDTFVPVTPGDETW